MSDNAKSGEELDSEINGAVARNLARGAVLNGLTTHSEAGRAPKGGDKKAPAKRSFFVRLVRFGRRSPGVGAAVGACIGFFALQGATYFQQQWKGNVDISTAEHEKELTDWLRKSGDLSPPTSSQEAAKIVSELEFQLMRYQSPNVRSKVIEMKEYFRRRQKEYEAVEALAMKAAEAVVIAEEQKRQAERAVQQAIDAKAAEAAREAVIAADQAAQIAAQEAKVAEERRAEIRDQIRTDRLMRLGVF